jgi:hypothetical protein
LGDRGRAAALGNLDLEPFLLVEALVARDEERCVLAIERPVQAELEWLRACARRNAERCNRGDGSNERKNSSCSSGFLLWFV